MTILTTTPGTGGVLPPEFGTLVEQPVSALSVAFLAGTQVRTSASEYHIPLLTTDTSAGFVAEGAEITSTDAVFDEIIVTPRKVAGLQVVSREFASDTSPGAADVIGRSIARQISAKVDHALFNPQTGAAPAGLANLNGISTVEYPAAGIDNLDPVHAAVSMVEAVGARVTHWIADAATALDLAQLKESTGSNRDLLSPDATAEGTRMLLGRPLLVSSAVPAGTIYGVDSSYMMVVVREGTRLEVDNSRYFETDRVGIKAVMRVAFGFPLPGAMVRLTAAAA